MKGRTAVYVPARRDEMLRNFNQTAVVELQRFRWRLFDRAVIEEDFAGALDIAAHALEEQTASYEALRSGTETPRLHNPYVDPVALYLAAMHGRLEIIDQVLGFEQFGLGRFSAREHKGTYERYRAILESVRKRPGILQIDLKDAFPGADTLAVTRLVDQLEATNLVATKKVGSRVAVWAADHPQAPSAPERRPQRWFWDVLEDTSDYYQGWLDPADTVADIEKIMRIVDEAARQPGIDEGRRPTPLDFIQTRNWQVTSPALSGGVPVYENAEQLAMAFWDHVDLAKATAIAERIIREDTETTPNQKKKWRLATPRHTHVERIPFTARFGRQEQGWLLREVAEPTADSVPATAFTASGVCTDPEKAAETGVACWLKVSKAKA